MAVNPSGEVERPYDPAILEGQKRGPSQSIETMTMKNKDGRVIRVNATDKAHIANLEKHGYQIVGNHGGKIKVSSNGAVNQTHQESEDGTYKVTAEDLQEYTIAELKEFCEDDQFGDNTLAWKSTWNKDDFIQALLEKKFVPSVETE